MTEPINEKQLKEFQQEILNWYAQHQRNLPWRELPFDPILKQRDPYKILISEVMSQQTQLSRVVPKYLGWIERFPTVQTLAEAPVREVLWYWSGLGYNRRALNLQKAAREINQLRMASGEGGTRSYWPRTVDELKKLPGIGEYTASAIACFAFNQQIAVVDTNVKKVILTHFCHPERKDCSSSTPSTSAGRQNDKILSDKELKRIAEQLVPRGKAYEWNQALMDYAAQELKKEKIPSKKPSHFKTSNRYFRGQTIKLLLKKKELTITQLAASVGKDRAFMEIIIQGLIKDGMIQRHNDNITLA